MGVQKYVSHRNNLQIKIMFTLALFSIHHCQEAMVHRSPGVAHLGHRDAGITAVQDCLFRDSTEAWEAMVSVPAGAEGRVVFTLEYKKGNVSLRDKV